MSDGADPARLLPLLLGEADREQRAQRCAAVLQAAGEGAEPELAEALAGALETTCAEAAAARHLAERLQAIPGSAAAWLRSRLYGWAKDGEAELQAMSQAVAHRRAPHAGLLLARARLLFRAKRAAEAAADLTLALSLHPPYAFYLKSEKLLQKVLASPAWKARRRCKLALLSSSTTALLAPVLQARAFACGLELQIYEGPYGNFRQEILNPDSGLYRFAPHFVLLSINSRDLHLPPHGGEEEGQEFCRQLRGLWQTLQQRHPCHLMQLGPETPEPGAWGGLEQTLPQGRRALLQQLRTRLSLDLPAGVSYLDPDAAAAHGDGPWFSAAEWHSAKQYPASASLPALAESALAQMRAALGMSAKVLVLDLDNTLWGGVVGEDGVGGIKIGPPSAEGEAYQELQDYAKELQQRGVLLAVCSKNNEADALLPFEQHEAMRLRRNDFVAFVANWTDKATNLAAMAEDLSLGLDSFVFLDDNPLERALMRRHCPAVIVPEGGPTPWQMLSALRRGQYFESLTLTREDLERHQSYRANVERRKVEKNSASLEEFLAGLEMVAENGAVDAATLSRVTQLINKTNQFNLTTRRYTEEQVRAMATSPRWWTRWFRLADKFGDYGLIGVMLAEKNEGCWRLDTWLMSCRVLGRQVEEHMIAVATRAAAAEGAKELRGEYLPTPKNGLVKDLYPRLGFAPAQRGGCTFTLSLQPSLPSCPFVREGKLAPAHS